MAQSIQREAAFLRRKQVETRTGLSRSTIYQYIKVGAFPKPVQLGARAVSWCESDVSDWIAVRVRVAREGSRQGADASALAVGRAQPVEKFAPKKKAINSGSTRSNTSSAAVLHFSGYSWGYPGNRKLENPYFMGLGGHDL